MKKYELIDSIYNKQFDEKQIKKYVSKFGTPIIDDRISENGKSKVIYICLTHSTFPQRICLVSNYDNKKVIDQNPLSQIEGTNIYYLIEEIPNNLWVSYLFCLDKGYFEGEMWNRSFYDINCRNKMPFFEKGIEKFISYYKMPKAHSRIIDNIEFEAIGEIVNKEIYSINMEENYKYTLYFPHDFNVLKNYKLLLLTGGEEYLHTMKLNLLLDYAIRKNIIRDVFVCFIYNNNREIELKCNDNFSKFIACEIIPEVCKIMSFNSEDIIIGGFSLGGLMAMYTALNYPDKIKNVLSCSGSFWWNLENPKLYRTKEYVNGILEKFKETEKLDLKIYMCLGRGELKDSIIGTNKELYNYLKKENYEVKLHKFKGCHDYLFWADEIILGLKYLQREDDYNANLANSH